MKIMKKLLKKIKAMSLFANVGIAETFLNEMGVDVVLANEISPERVNFYRKLYPSVDVITGDIANKNVQEELIKKAIDNKINLIIATPPCQGMSTAGKKDSSDYRNNLICEAVKVIKATRPDYVLIENVPQQLITKIIINNKEILIPEYVKNELNALYNFQIETINTANYGVAQTRERAIFLLTLKEKNNVWKFPKKSNTIITMESAIGDLPPLDPLINDIPYEKHLNIFPLYETRKELAINISKWHYPPSHVHRQVYAMIHTPTGKSAFENKEEFKPKKLDGNTVKGYKNTYKRQEWIKPAFTVTMFNRTIGSQNNVHPGRLIGVDSLGNSLYSDPRVLTIFELMRIMSLPDSWNIPEGYSDNFIRSVIGEGIPPLFVKKLIEVIPYET